MNRWERLQTRYSMMSTFHGKMCWTYYLTIRSWLQSSSLAMVPSWKIKPMWIWGWIICSRRSVMWPCPAGHQIIRTSSWKIDMLWKAITSAQIYTNGSTSFLAISRKAIGLNFQIICFSRTPWKKTSISVNWPTKSKSMLWHNKSKVLGSVQDSCSKMLHTLKGW